MGFLKSLETSLTDQEPPRPKLMDRMRSVLWASTGANAPAKSVLVAGSDLSVTGPGPDWPDFQKGSRQRVNGQSTAHTFGGLLVQVTYVLIDVVSILICSALAFLLRFSPEDVWRFFLSGRWVVTTEQPVSRYGAFLLLYAVLILLLFNWQGLYRTPRTRSAWEETIAVCRAVFLATLLLGAFVFLSGDKIVSRLVVLVSLLLNVVSLATWRYIKRQIVIHRTERGIGVRNVVIVGAGTVGQALARHLETHKQLGYCFKGFLDGNHSTDPRRLGNMAELSRITRSEFIDEVFVTIPSERELVKELATQARTNGLTLKVVPDLYDGLAWNAPIYHIDEFPIIDLCWRSIPLFGLLIKRILDVAFAGIALLVCSPLLAILAMSVKLNSSGPAIYRSRRVGQKGREFDCFKLRSMVANADELKNGLRGRNEREGPFFKITDDPRVTRVGRFLRKYSLDELPQLWNVLKGDMSLVGPRPHPVDDFEQYSLDDFRRLEVKPGITGLWQVIARKDPSFRTSMELDIRYIESWSLALDIKIVVKTIPAILRAEGS